MSSSPNDCGILLCSVDSFREATESGEGSPQRHPVQSATHDPRQEVPPQDIQVGVFSQLQLCAMFTENCAGIQQKKKKKKYLCVADSVV